MRKLGELVIVGTSNSWIRNGFSGVLDSYFAPVTNLAIGASTNVMHAFRRPQMIHIRDATAIFDFCVNETNLRARFKLSESIQSDSIDSFLGTCGDQRLLPLMLIMPSGWTVARHGPVRANYIAKSTERRLPWFDGFVYNERVYDVMPSLRVHGWVQHAHVEPIIARMIGRAMARGMAKVMAERRLDWVPVRDVATVEAVFVADHFPRERLTERKTRLDHRWTLVVKAGEEITLPIPSDADIVGLAINAGNSNGVLKVSTGAATRTKYTHTHLYGRPYIIVVWPFAEPIPVLDASVRIGCLHPNDSPSVDEINENMVPGVDMSSVGIELAGLIVRRRRVEALFPTLDRPVDIVGEMTDAEILEDVQAEIAATEIREDGALISQAARDQAARDRALKLAEAAAARRRVDEVRMAHQAARDEATARAEAARTAAAAARQRVAEARALHKATHEKATQARAAQLAARHQTHAPLEPPTIPSEEQAYPPDRHQAGEVENAAPPAPEPRKPRKRAGPVAGTAKRPTRRSNRRRNFEDRGGL